MEKNTLYSSHEQSIKDEVSVLNTYAPNARTPTNVEETLLKLKLHIKPHILIVEDFNTPFSSIDRSTRKKFNRATRELTKLMTQMDIRNNYRTFHSNT